MTAKELREQFSNELGIGSHGWSLITQAAYLEWLEKKYIEQQAKSREEAEERYKGRRIFIESFLGETAKDPEAKIFNALHQQDEIIWLVEEKDFKELNK